MTKTIKYVFIWATVLGLIYTFCVVQSSNGYGYVGYYGYHRGPSFWYIGGPKTYHQRNSRSGSVNGASTRGGGPGSGK